MINKINPVRLKTTLNAATTVAKESKLDKFFQSKGFNKTLEIAGSDPVKATALASLFICVGPRPATNFAITPDKKDAAYASGHSWASGAIGYLWPLIFVTPLSKAVNEKTFAKHVKYLKAETIKKFFPNVGIEETINKNGKKILKVMKNEEGKLLRQDGTVLPLVQNARVIEGADAAKELQTVESKIGKLRTKSENTTSSFMKKHYDSKIDKLESKKVELNEKHKAYLEEKQNFEAEHPNLYVDKGGVVRSKIVPKTKEGKIQYDSKGKEIGCAVNKEDLSPMTEDLEHAKNMESCTKDIFKYGNDIGLAVPRAMLTIACIPPILKAFGLSKSNKNATTVGNNNTAYKSVKGMNNFKAQVRSISATSKSPAFKGNPSKLMKGVLNASAEATKKEGLFARLNDSVQEFLAKHVVAPLTDKMASGKMLDKLKKKESLTQEMSIAGSFVTTGAYMGSTLNSKKMEKKRARTLALNQALVTVISTIGALTINNKVAKSTKNLSFRYIKAMKSKNLPEAVLDQRVAGFKALQQILTFTMMYRYIAPVVVTPLASTISKALMNNKPVKEVKKA